MKLAQYVTGDTWGEITPETLGKGLGGRETAAVKLALEWAELGHEVYFFGPVGRPYHHRTAASGVASFVSSDMLPGMMDCFEWDALLTWEESAVAGLPRLRENVKVIFCGMQVSHIPTKTRDSFHLLDGWVALSDWHRRFMRTQDVLMEKARIEVLPNGVDFADGRFSYAEFLLAAEHKKVAHEPRFLYASSPDRGLHHVLRLWPKIREEWPNATLKIVYGIENFVHNVRWMHRSTSEIALDVQELIHQDGVEYIGRVGQDVVAQLHLESDILIYPCDPLSPTETGCITVMEALAGGCTPVITDADCLESEFGGVAVIVPLPYDEDKYLEALKRVISGIRPDIYIGRDFADDRNWRLIANEWIEMFQETIDLKQKQAEEVALVGVAN